MAKMKKSKLIRIPPFPKLKNSIVPPTPRLNHCIPSKRQKTAWLIDGLKQMNPITAGVLMGGIVVAAA
jgi:hypothetical protein